MTHPSQLQKNESISGDVAKRADDKYVESGATISKCGKYRYTLWREWRGAGLDKNWQWLGGKDPSGERYGFPKNCVFVMLNPSTADGEQDDPTIRRCVGFAKAWGFDRLVVVNLFAFRATEPKTLLALKHDDDPVGTENQERIRKIIQDAGLIVCAWGAHGGHMGQDETLLGWLAQDNIYDAPIRALGLTKEGHPKHPLYVPAKAALIPFDGATNASS